MCQTPRQRPRLLSHMPQTFCHSGVHTVVGLPGRRRNQRRHTWEQERYLVIEWWRACSRISKHGLEWGSWDFGMQWEMGARKTFSRNWAETKYGKVYLFTSRGPKSVTEAELQLRKVPAGPRAALRDSCFIQHCAAGEASRRWNGGSQNLCRDKWHCDFPWHPLKFLTNFQKYLMFALKQPVGLRHFSWNTSEKQSNPSHLSIPSPNRPGREPLTYWRPTQDTGLLRSWPRAMGMVFSLFSHLHLCSWLLARPAGARAEEPKSKDSKWKRGGQPITAVPGQRAMVATHQGLILLSLKFYGRACRLMRII